MSARFACWMERAIYDRHRSYEPCDGVLELRRAQPQEMVEPYLFCERVVARDLCFDFGRNVEESGALLVGCARRALDVFAPLKQRLRTAQGRGVNEARKNAEVVGNFVDCRRLALKGRREWTKCACRYDEFAQEVSLFGRLLPCGEQSESVRAKGPRHPRSRRRESFPLAGNRRSVACRRRATLGELRDGGCRRAPQRPVAAHSPDGSPAERRPCGGVAWHQLRHCRSQTYPFLVLHDATIAVGTALSTWVRAAPRTDPSGRN